MMAYLLKNVKNLWRQNFAKNIAIFLGYFSKKNFRHGLKKVAKMAKIRHIWSHWIFDLDGFPSDMTLQYNELHARYFRVEDIEILAIA